ncbi:hypothetical protein ALC57_16738 [Trachymyrmex cornetzi]|uniref:Uncharacterized protein n=1 Tax=Trachymyrmex cornetzi TaxID=471704 RepID=A0A151IUK6_9HYME|nr:hypothetical protein ALC57_16738 [Trachymyrmex cornetzi]
MGLIVDIPKPGFGSSNDGNTSRRFLANPKLSSEITGVDEVLIERFGNILSALNYKEAISYTKFGKYAYETARMFVKLYPWYDMPPSVHKVLIHGSDFIQYSLLPLRMLFTLFLLNIIMLQSIETNSSKILDACNIDHYINLHF